MLITLLRWAFSILNISDKSLAMQRVMESMLPKEVDPYPLWDKPHSTAQHWPFWWLRCSLNCCC